MTDDISDHIDTIRERYENHFHDKDDGSVEAVHWKTSERLKIRYDVLADIADLDGTHVLDFGCGTALFADFLNERGVDCEYEGWDISKDMLEVAGKHRPDATFRQIDILKEDTSQYQDAFDYVVVCGVFHIRAEGTRDAHERWIHETLRELWPLCTKGLAVNFMTEHVDWRDEELYYCEIDDLVDFCTEHLSRWLTIRRDYELYEHTAYVYKHPTLNP